MTTSLQRIAKDDVEKIVLSNINDFGWHAVNAIGKLFPFDQIVWPNNDGLYPWDANAPDTFKHWQPVLGPAPTGV